MTTTALAERTNGSATTAADRLWTEEQKQAIRQQLVPSGARITDADLALFGMICERGGFDPFLRQVYLLPTKEGPKIHVGIDGLRLIAARTGGVDSTDGPYWCGTDGKWTDVWLSSDPPAAAKYGVRRRGAQGFVYAVALMREFRGSGPNWSQRPAHQLAIVAERHALRKAFQHELAGEAQQLRRVAQESGADVLVDYSDADEALPALDAPAADPPADPWNADLWDAAERQAPPPKQTPARTEPVGGPPATQAQLAAITALCRATDSHVDTSGLTEAQAREIIARLNAEAEAVRAARQEGRRG